MIVVGTRPDERMVIEVRDIGVLVGMIVRTTSVDV